MISWNIMLPEMLGKIFKNLESKDLQSCAHACQSWRLSATANALWKDMYCTYFKTRSPQLSIFDSYFHEMMFFRTEIPLKPHLIIDYFDNPIERCVFSHSGNYFVLWGDRADFYVYESRSLELIHERFLKPSRGWTSIQGASFSQDDSKLMIFGNSKNHPPFSSEVAIFSINGPSRFVPCWYDNSNILTADVYPIRESFQSISQLSICAADPSANVIIRPFLRLLNKYEYARNVIISNRVSPRFRRIVQLSEQAKTEEKTLNEKINELKASADIETDNITALKNILDKDSECFRCYLNHISFDKNASMTDCDCVCHDESRKLFIYVAPETKEKCSLCFKIIDHKKYLEDQPGTSQSEGTSVAEQEESLDDVLSAFDNPDYQMSFDSPIYKLNITTDHKSLYVHLRTTPANGRHRFKEEFRVVDLETMTLHPTRDFGLREENIKSITSNENLCATATNEIKFWSKKYPTKQLAKLKAEALFGMEIKDISLHPTLSKMIVVTDKGACIFRS